MSLSQPQSPDRISISKDTPIEYWCHLLHCEKQDLLHAISVIGSSLNAVDSFLVLNRKKHPSL